jgi:uncharacterized membrane protein
MTSFSNGVLVEKPRISSIDIMRGIVMVIMALDHTRDYFHVDAFNFDPTDMTKTHPMLFFTRWITHFCAPIFVLLSGIAARISLERKTKKELSVFLLTRGLWLIVLELTVIRFGFVFNLYYDFTIFQVIWVIGASMVFLSSLIFLPERIILFIGLLIVFGHNLFDRFQLQPGDSGFLLWTFLFQSGVFEVAPGKTVLVPYALFPWLGILLTGFGLGAWYSKAFDATVRKKYLLRTGILAILLFVVLRFINQYGDPAPWSQQKNLIFTLMSFLNCTKYPVSLLYTLMTIGPALIVLSVMETINTNPLKPIIVFGRVPMYYYILHFYLIHSLALVLLIFTTGIDFSSIDFHFSKGFGGIPPNAGVTLPWVYVAWIGVVVLLYPVCKWYNQYKSSHKDWWLSYL